MSLITEEQTSTIHKQRHTPLQYTNITTLCLKYLYIGYEHNGFSFGDSVWNVPEVHVCHRANMVSSCFPCCRSGCLFFSVCFFWKTLALYGSPMVAFTSTHTFKAYEAVSSRTKRSCFLQHFTPRHKRLLCQHHGRRHKIPLQILGRPPVSHQGLPVLPYFPSTWNPGGPPASVHWERLLGT